MFDTGGGAAIAAELEQARDQLRSVGHRVAEASLNAPRTEASGWDGTAAWAYQRCLDRLTRELEVAGELLRSATELTTLAVFEVGGHV